MLRNKKNRTSHMSSRSVFVCLKRSRMSKNADERQINLLIRSSFARRVQHTFYNPD